MKLFAAVFVLLEVGAVAQPQAVDRGTASSSGSVAIAPAAKPSDDEEWAAVTSLLTPKSNQQTTLLITANGGALRTSPSKTNSQISDDRMQQAQAYKSASTAAKQYYSNHPESGHAADARKAEAIAGLLGVPACSQAEEQDAEKTATVFRMAKANSAADRFEVALLQERVQARDKLGGIYGSNAAELEKIGAKLLAEFSDLPDAYYFYCSIARTADSGTALRIAASLLKAKGAPTEAVVEAQSIVDRQALVGTTLKGSLATAEGKPFDLSGQSGRLTVIYFLSRQSGVRGLTGLAVTRASFPLDTQIVFVCVDGGGDQIRQLRAVASSRDIFCLDLPKPDSTTAKLLRVSHLPFVYVLNRAGRISGFGPVSQLQTLVTAASK